MPTLQRLKPGTRFRLAEMPEITGVLVNASEWRAVVRLDCQERDIEFDEQPRQFRSRGTRVTSWAPAHVPELRCLGNRSASLAAKKQGPGQYRAC